MRLDSETLYRKTGGGTWYYRFQINGKRKAVSLKLRDKDKALEAAKKLVMIPQSDNAEVIAAHVKFESSGRSPKKQPHGSFGSRSYVARPSAENRRRKGKKQEGSAPSNSPAGEDRLHPGKRVGRLPGFPHDAIPAKLLKNIFLDFPY